MANKTMVCLFFVLVCFFSVHAQNTTAIARADSIARVIFEEGNFPGLAIAVWDNDQVAWTHGYGYADISAEKKIDPEKSLFRIGSVSKTITSVGLMKLVEDDKISLDREIADLVAAFPEKKYPLTVRQAAQHTGGIRHYRNMEMMSNVHYERVSDGLSIFAADTLLFAPGERFSYSSYGWNLISAAMETASGTEFLTFMSDEVFKPLELKRTMADDATKEMKWRVSFYNMEEGENVPAPPVDNSYKWAGGGFLSTATDLISFGKQVVFDQLIIGKDALETSWTPATLNDGSQTTYGIGWAVGTDAAGRSWVGHAGGSIGGTTMFLVYPEQEVIVVTLVNQSEARMENLAFKLADAFLAD